MTKELRDKLLTETKKGRLYDFIANEYWQLSKDELTNIAKECAFILCDPYESYVGYTMWQRLELLADNLSDCIYEDED